MASHYPPLPDVASHPSACGFNNKAGPEQMGQTPERLPLAPLLTTWHPFTAPSAPTVGERVTETSLKIGYGDM